MSAGQGSCPLPWHRASFPVDLFPQSQPHRAALEVRQKTVPLFDLLQRLRRLQTGHLRLPCSNQHRPQGHSRFPPHPPFPDILKITDREEVKYSFGPHCYQRNGNRYLGASPSEKSVKRVKLKVNKVVVPGNMKPWPEVRDQLNRLLRGWSAYFCYGTRGRAYKAVDHHVCGRVRHFLS